MPVWDSQIYFVECVSKIKHILSVIHYTICGAQGLYVFSLPISLVMIERIYILCLIIIIKSEVWNITYCLGLGHETMVSAVCLSIFLWWTESPGTLIMHMIKVQWLYQHWQQPSQGSTLSFLSGCPKSHILGWYRNFLVYWYLKLDNQVVNSTCPRD